MPTPLAVFSGSPGKTGFKNTIKSKEEWVLVAFAKCIEIWPLKNTFGIKLSLLLRFRNTL